MQQQKPSKARPQARRPHKRRISRSTKMVIRWLLLCFPAGLLMMWSARCRWNRAVKSLVSLAFAAAVIALVVPQTLPPERAKGGVQIVSSVSAVDIAGPHPTEGADEYASYDFVPDQSLLVAPSPTPVPVYVYCNDGGKYYHSKKCRYVKDTTPKATLSQAITAGFKQCSDCDAPAAVE